MLLILIHESLCSGLVTEVMALDARGIDAETIGVADTAALAQKWIKYKYGNRAHRSFTNNQAFIDGFGDCTLCSGTSKAKTVCSITDDTPDLTCAGLSCVAFTTQRPRNNPDNSRTGAPHNHPEYHTATGQRFQYLETRNPNGWIVETSDALLQVNPFTGKTYLA